MSKEIMQQALTVLKAWDELIKYQYGGSSEAMTAMQNVAWRTLDTIEGLETELANLTPNIEDASQDWAKLDGAVAWHLIERHAENWGDVGKMMDEYVAAKLTKPEQDHGFDRTASHIAGEYVDTAKPEQELPTLRQVVIESALKSYGKPEQEPVGQFVGGIPEVSQQREWVGLTDEEVYEIANFCKDQPFNFYAKEIQTKLKKLNT